MSMSSLPAFQTFIVSPKDVMFSCSVCSVPAAGRPPGTASRLATGMVGIQSFHAAISNRADWVPDPESYLAHQPWGN